MEQNRENIMIFYQRQIKFVMRGIYASDFNKSNIIFCTTHMSLSPQYFFRNVFHAAQDYFAVYRQSITDSLPTPIRATPTSTPSSPPSRYALTREKC